MQTLIAVGTLILSSSILAQGNSIHEATYEVTFTNVTSGIYFTPLIVATHTEDSAFFEPGQPPSQPLADLAEGGATMPLAMALDDAGVAGDIQFTEGGLIGPGESRTVVIQASLRHYNRLSLAGMLLPTNDSFVAINALPLDKQLQQTQVYALAYDAGSEANDELCANIPGPQCGGEPFSLGLGEGFVHISSGIQGAGDLDPAQYDWRNPVAAITVVRID
ncbi:MAG: spondin domain-containing protein [Gammaproteobacteria bacterium]|nr:spondin domain-containing protein [Gammaproteobacteria bacterium]